MHKGRGEEQGLLARNPTKCQDSESDFEQSRYGRQAGGFFKKFSRCTSCLLKGYHSLTRELLIFVAIAGIVMSIVVLPHKRFLLTGPGQLTQATK